MPFQILTNSNLRRTRTPTKSKKEELQVLRTLAHAVGIQTSYVDMAGNKRSASPETLKALLPYWGIQSGTFRELAEGVKELEQAHARQILPAVSVAWNGKPVRVHVTLPKRLKPTSVAAELQLESGQVHALPNISTDFRGRSGVIFVSTPKIPFGYHQLQISFGTESHRGLLIAAPEQSYSPPEELRELGLFAPMYALHSCRSWGAGNLKDWAHYSQWAADCGCSVISTLPILAAFLEKPLCDPSPYSPASRLFWNDFYIDIEAIPEFASSREVRALVRSSAFQERLKLFRRERLIDYEAQMKLRRSVLERMAHHFFKSDGVRHRAFQDFQSDRPDVLDYAAFRAACDQSGASWHTWEPDAKNGLLSSRHYRETGKRFQLYCQWLIQDQMTAFLDQARERKQQFYLDLPLGVNPNGYDLWRYRGAFAFPASAGAPPDPFFTKGQNWGFAPLHPRGLRESRYEYFIKFLRFQMRHTGLLRIDHVMSLHRLYWIPSGLPATHGAYVRYPADELQAILCLESHRHKTVLAGENLGTVPPEVTKDMKRHQFREIYALQYEQRPNPRKPVRTPIPLSVAGINTHDMPSFAAHWSGADLKLRLNLDLIKATQMDSENRNRENLKKALVQFLRNRGLLAPTAEGTNAVLVACLRWLSGSPAEILLVTLEDLWAETETQNVPGTSTEMPNWRRKTRLSLEQITRSRPLKRLLKALAARKSSA